MQTRQKRTPQPLKSPAIPSCLTIWIPLVDVHDESCGPTQFYPGSHATWRAEQYVGLAEDECHLPNCTPRLDRGSRRAPAPKPTGASTSSPQSTKWGATRAHALARECAPNVTNLGSSTSTPLSRTASSPTVAPQRP